MASVHLTLARASIDAGLPGLVLHHASAAELLAAREGHRRTARLARTVRSAQQVSLGSRSEMLVQVASRVARAPTLQDTLQAVVDASLQLLPVDRVFVLTKGAEGMEPVASASRRQPVGEPSWSVVSRVARTGEEVFTSDARTQDELADNSSLIRRGVHTVLAVPLMVDDVAVGVLYADAAITARQELTQVAWQLRTLAAQATQALHHDRLLRDSRQREHTAREVVHDVRNLLAALDGGVEWLRELIPSDADDDGVLADMGEGIRRSVAQLQRLLDGQTPVSERVAPRAVADDASMLLRHEARRRAVQVDVQGPYVEVDADRDELCRALFNLLGNALKYSPPHDVVVVRVIADGVWARVEVEDRGPGLPPGLDPFVSGVQGPDAAPGHGLGLGIVASVAARWGGDASVRPGETGGTVFELRLPIASSKEVPRSEKEPST
jgi:signal transduction histidine kinase